MAWNWLQKGAGQGASSWRPVLSGSLLQHPGRTQGIGPPWERRSGYKRATLHSFTRPANARLSHPATHAARYSLRFRSSLFLPLVLPFQSHSKTKLSFLARYSMEKGTSGLRLLPGSGYFRSLATPLVRRITDLPASRQPRRRESKISQRS